MPFPRFDPLNPLKSWLNPTLEPPPMLSVQREPAYSQPSTEHSFDPTAPKYAPSTVPVPQVLWSTCRMVPDHYGNSTTQKLFSTIRHTKGQGFSAPLEVEQTNLMFFPLPVGLRVRRIEWFARFAYSESPLEEFARTAVAAPENLSESLFGLIVSGYLVFNFQHTVIGNYVLDANAPLGPLDWRNAENWRGGVDIGAGMCLNIEPSCVWDMKLCFRTKWNPKLPVDLTFTLLP